MAFIIAPTSSLPLPVNLALLMIDTASDNYYYAACLISVDPLYFNRCRTASTAVTGKYGQ